MAPNTEDAPNAEFKPTDRKKEGKPWDSLKVSEIVAAMMENMPGKEIFLWESLTKSAIFLGGLWFCFICIQMGLTVFDTLFNLAYLVLVAGTFLKILDKAPDDIQLGGSEGKRRLSSMIGTSFDSIEKFLKDIVLWKDKQKTIAAVVVLYFVGTITAYTNILNVCFFASNFLFVVPVLVEKKKDLVDTYGKLALDQLKKVIEMIPKSPKDE